MSLSISSILSRDTTIFVGIWIALPVLCSFCLARWRSSHLPFPPGPPGDPIIGNLRQMSGVENQAEEFEKWGKQYGDVNFLKIFSQPLVVLNSFAAAKDLLEKRGAIYSSRPRLVLISELMSWGDVLVHQETGPRFRKHRRLVQERFSGRSLEKYVSLQRQEVHTTLSHLGSSPEHVLTHINRFAASIVLNITYGRTVLSREDDFVKLADQAILETVSVTPAGMLVDFFPILRYWPTFMPLSGWKRHAIYTRGLVQKLFDIPYYFVKEQFAKGTASPCIAVDLLETQSDPQSSEALDDSDIRDITGVLYAAGSESTSVLAFSFVLLMVLNPEILKKAQAEIDQKVGTDRLLEFDDRVSLPYFECVLKELFRWTCPVPLGVPHRSTENDVYRNQFIPKDSTVMANIWAMMRNEAVYPESHKFDPERFVGKLDTKAAQQVDSIFGFGRRVCPGKVFAESNLWLLLSNMIAMFSIEKALDESGKPITPPGDFTAGYVRHPKAFPYKIKYRSDKAKAVIAGANLIHD